MKAFEVIKGGPKFHDPDEIPGPDKPIEEWTAEDHEAYSLILWEIAEKPSIEYAVKTMDVPAASLETTLSVLEAVQQSCAREAAALGLRDIFRNENIPNLIWCIRQRLKELNKSPEE